MPQTWGASASWTAEGLPSGTPDTSLQYTASVAQNWGASVPWTTPLLSPHQHPGQLQWLKSEVLIVPQNKKPY